MFFIKIISLYSCDIVNDTTGELRQLNGGCVFFRLRPYVSHVRRLNGRYSVFYQKSKLLGFLKLRKNNLHSGQNSISRFGKFGLKFFQ